ncbi:MAG TPA: FxLYD domain-containing protein [Candidatus Binatia bacterium]|nr:FxLYD domain-containing protein [Candidatus Binatia bacterium]
MTPRSAGWSIAIVACLELATVARTAQAEEAAIVEQHGQWEMSYGAVYYRAFGYVENKSSKPIRYVKLELDLVDASGKTVYTTIGYNQKAEALGTVEGEGADTVKKTAPEEALKKIEPLKPGEKDLFRIGVSKDDIPKKPKFKTYQLKIVEVK